MDYRTLSVLVIEDDPDDAMLLVEMLTESTSTRFDVQHVDTLEQGLERLKHSRPDVVLLDLSLPDSQGLETVTRLRQESQEIPVVVLTGLDDEEVALKALEDGAQDYLIKGNIATFQLSRSLHYAVERHRILTRLQHFDRTKSEFVATVSHELRTPLAIIREHVSLVLDGVVGPVVAEQKDCLEGALRNCDRLTRLVNGLLDLSRIESGRIRLNRRKTTLGPLLEQCVADFQHSTRTKGQSLELEQDVELPAVVCDGEMVGQVLYNLLSNANKYTGHGGRIRLRALEETDSVRLEVEDNGPGLSEEEQKIIFEAFVRVQGSVSRGTGLGLTIADRLVQLHGTTLTVESSPGRGTRLSFSLPACTDRLALEIFVDDRLRCAGREPRTLILLRGAASAAREPHRDLDEIFRSAPGLAREVFRGDRDESLFLASTPMLALLFESDESGSAHPLFRLIQALEDHHGALPALALAATPIEASRTAREWIQQLETRFVPLEQTNGRRLPCL